MSGLRSVDSEEDEEVVDEVDEDFLPENASQIAI